MEQEQEKIPMSVHSSWHEYLQPLFDDVKMMKLKYKILPSIDYYPARDSIFKVFSMPIDQIKVCIIGQDPYPNGEAIGLSFAVPSTVKIPPSLQVVAREIELSGLKTGFFDSDIPEWRTLEHWTKQGVFLLNSALTVEAFKSSSHLNYWQWFTKEVIKIISRVAKPVWMLWGVKAQGFSHFIEGGEIMKKDVDIELNMGSLNNLILTASHPAAEFYKDSRSKATFKGCNHFQMCNKILEMKKEKIINW